MRPFHFLPLCLTTLLLLSCCNTSRSLAADTEIEAKMDVVYGEADGVKLLLDHYQPKGLDRDLPAIICIHGGGWAAGDKRDFADAARQFAKAGYVTTSINYRHAPQFVFPAQVEDCKCAVRWLRAHAKEMHVDPQRIGAMGGSAGGHLVMMLGTMDKSDGLEGNGGWPDQSSKVQAVMSLFGPTNLVGDWPPTTQGILTNFIGGDQKAKKDAYTQASPIKYVNAGDAPMLLFQGTKDVLVPYDQAFQMATALTNANVPGRVEILLGAGHGWGGKQLEETVRQTVDFFNTYLKP